MNWYLHVLSKYTEFNGSDKRSEYWYFILINFFITLTIYIFDAVVGSVGALGIVYSLGVLIPGLAVAVRRLHDTGRSGWYLFLTIIPLRSNNTPSIYGRR